MAGTSEVDLVKIGVLWQKVESMEKQVDRLECKVDQLLELANKSKGGLWLGMTIVAISSTLIGFFIKYWKG